MAIRCRDIWSSSCYVTSLPGDIIVCRLLLDLRHLNFDSSIYWREDQRIKAQPVEWCVKHTEALWLVMHSNQLVADLPRIQSGRRGKCMAWCHKRTRLASNDFSWTFMGFSILTVTQEDPLNGFDPILIRQMGNLKRRSGISGDFKLASLPIQVIVARVEHNSAQSIGMRKKVIPTWHAKHAAVRKEGQRACNTDHLLAIISDMPSVPKA